MSEEELIERTPEPATISSLSKDLKGLGIREGETLLVHSSPRAIGWVAGREQAVVLALQGHRRRGHPRDAVALQLSERSGGVVQSAGARGVVRRDPERNRACTH